VSCGFNMYVDDVARNVGQALHAGVSVERRTRAALKQWYNLEAGAQTRSHFTST